jgi:hypothetical protein
VKEKKEERVMREGERRKSEIKSTLTFQTPPIFENKIM